MRKIGDVKIPELTTEDQAYRKKIQEAREREEAWKKQTSFKLTLPNWYKPDNPKIINDLQKTLENPDKPKHFLFVGNVGCGKTLITNIITDTVIPANYRNKDYYKYLNCFSAWEKIKGIYSSAYNEKGEYVDQLLRPAPFCFIDDIGSEDDTPASRSHITSLLMNVYNYWFTGNLKVLVMTTNLGINALQERYGERIRSRLDEMVIYYQMKRIDHREAKRRGINERA